MRNCKNINKCQRGFTHFSREMTRQLKPGGRVISTPAAQQQGPGFLIPGPDEACLPQGACLPQV